MGSIAEHVSLNDFGIGLQDPTLLGGKGLIAGKWVDAKSGETFPVYEPSSGKVLEHCASFSKDEFVEAIESAHKGYKAFYASTTAKNRGEILQRWSDLILANKKDLAVILCLENGKTQAEAEGEIAYAASFVSWFAAEAPRSYGDVIPSSSKDTVVLTFKEPVGVCGIITPWNFPAAMITRKIAPAFAAGCSVVIKPPSETPFSALAFSRLALQAGVPADCIHVLPTKNRDAGSELARHPKVNKISFTGSTSVGVHLTQLAAATLKRVSMELGGNAPFLVWDDADLDKAVEGAMASKFRCTGQTCVCANRIFVHADVADAFAEKLSVAISKLQLGPGWERSVTQGPLVNAAAVKKVQSHVDDALQKGGKLICGGKPPARDGFFFEPTLISNGTKDMLVASDETFGPLAVIFPFRTEEEAIELANDTEFGLAAYFYTKDNSRVMRVAQALQSGMVAVNTGMISAAESPFGGIKDSGYGREGSKYGLAEYQNIKSVTMRY